MSICSDNFNGGVAASSISGRISSGGQTWSGNLDSGHVGNVILYPLSGASTKAGASNVSADSSSIFALTAVPPTPDYGVDFTFEFGNNVAGKTSLGPVIRFQETVASPTLHYYGAWYNGNVGRWEIILNNGGGSTPIGTYSNAYASGTILNYTLRACGTTIELIEAGVTIINVTNGIITLAGQAGIVQPSAGASFSSLDGWWITDFVANENACTEFLNAQFGLYFAGSGIDVGQDFTPVQYGLPTIIVIPNPQAGLEFAIPALPVDLAGFLSGRMGNLKLRRSGADPQATIPVVCRGISIMYRKKKT